MRGIHSWVAFIGYVDLARPTPLQVKLQWMSTNLIPRLGYGRVNCQDWGFSDIINFHGFITKASTQVSGHQLWLNLERDRLRQVSIHNKRYPGRYISLYHLSNKLNKRTVQILSCVAPFQLTQLSEWGWWWQWSVCKIIYKISSFFPKLLHIV